MITFNRWMAAAALALGCAAPGLCAELHSALVYPGPDGRLVSTPDAQGNVIPDFSHCGYMGGGVAIPALPVKATVEPDGDTLDDTARIQAAVDAVAQLAPGPDGRRGAVMLRGGSYHLEGTLAIAARGVALRGEGAGPDGTVLIATSAKRQTVVKVGGESDRRETPGTRRAIGDDYVPVGATTFTVDDASPFAVGDEVIVHRPSTAEWIHELGMDRIPAIENTVQWAPGEFDLEFERRITAIDGNRITIDVPLVNALERRYGGGLLYKYSFPGRIEHVGVESIRFVSEYDPAVKLRHGQGAGSYEYPADDEHGWTAITMNNVRDSWVRDVTSEHIGMHLVTVGRQASRITIQDCAFLDAVSTIAGGFRYPFNLGGQQTLVMRCYARTGRHDFVLSSRVAGPNAFVDCKSELAYATTEPHHRWAAGTLYDYVSTDGPGAGLCALNRGNNGSGHGWMGAQTIFWNCRAPIFVLMKPPTAQNYAIGGHGLVADSEELRNNIAGRLRLTNQKNMRDEDFTYEGIPFVGDAHFEHPSTAVTPRSLYLKQLEDRLGAAAVANVASPAQLDGSVMRKLGNFPPPAGEGFEGVAAHFARQTRTAVRRLHF